MKRLSPTAFALVILVIFVLWLACMIGFAIDFNLEALIDHLTK